MQLILQKLQTSQSEATNARFVRLYHFMSAKTDAGMGADFVIKIIDAIQADLYVQLYLNIILPGTPKLARPLDRKVAVISLTKTLGESQAFAERYKKGWTFSCDRLLELLINPPVVADRDDIVPENDVDDSAFGVGFTPLISIRKTPRDYWPETSNVKSWVGDYLKSSDARQGGKISGFVQERLPEQSKQALLGIMQG
jgi:exportin-2 (importin alpha re-exporter)